METILTICVIVGMVSLFVVMFRANRRFIEWLEDRPLNDDKPAPKIRGG